MKSSKGIIHKRQRTILQRLKEEHTVHVGDLVEELEVSPLTIRRDLQAFEEQGLISRFHGGATIVDGALAEHSTTEETAHPDEVLNVLPKEPPKERLARYAASLVEHGDTIFLNSSSTTLLMLNYLGGKRVTVVTNNGKALAMARDAGVELVLTGGEVYPYKQSMVGDMAISALKKIVANKAFIGVSGISAQNGVTSSVLQETAINRLMMKQCNGNCFVLADGSKVGIQNNFFSGPIQLIKTLITDETANVVEVERIRLLGIQVIKVGP